MTCSGIEAGDGTPGGVGGTGVSLIAGGALTNSGTIYGGKGGAVSPSAITSQTQSAGAGGVGVVLTGVTLNNSGKIGGGYGGYGGNSGFG